MNDLDTSQQLSTIAMFDEIWHQVAPGGNGDMAGLTNSVRNPGGVNTVDKEGRGSVDGHQLKYRMGNHGVPASSCYDKVNIQTKMVKQLCLNIFKHVWNIFET